MTFGGPALTSATADFSVKDLTKTATILGAGCLVTSIAEIISQTEAARGGSVAVHGDRRRG